MLRGLVKRLCRVVAFPDYAAHNLQWKREVMMSERRKRMWTRNFLTEAGSGCRLGNGMISTWVTRWVFGLSHFGIQMSTPSAWPLLGRCYTVDFGFPSLTRNCPFSIGLSQSNNPSCNPVQGGSCFCHTSHVKGCITFHRSLVPYQVF